MSRVRVEERGACRHALGATACLAVYGPHRLERLASISFGDLEVHVTDPDGHVLRFGSEPLADRPLVDWASAAG